jgi:PKD repeat protein
LPVKPYYKQKTNLKMRTKPLFLSTLLILLLNISEGFSQLDCSNPHNVLINCTANWLPYELCGTTIGAPSNVSIYNSNNYDHSGGEQIIMLNLKDGTPFSDDVSIDLTLNNSAGVDFDIYLFSSCDLNNWLASAENGSTTTETLSYTGSSIWDIEDAFIVIDGYEGAEADYELMIDVQYVNSSSNPVNSIDSKLQQANNDPVISLDSFPFTSSVWPLVGTTTQDVSIYSCGDEGIFTNFRGSENIYKIETTSISNISVELTQTSGAVQAFIYRQSIYGENCSPIIILDCHRCIGYATEGNPFTLQDAPAEEYFIVVDAPVSGGYTINVNDCGWLQKGNDIDGEAAENWSGYSVSLSSDGSRLAVGAIFNNGNGSDAGHVRIYDQNMDMWMQVGSDIDAEAAGDWLGYAVSLSSDGSRLAIGARNNGGNGAFAGHTRIYEENGGVWTQIGSDIDGEAAGDEAARVSLSSDGKRVAIGAPNNDGNGNDAGHVRIYEENGGVWTQVGSDIDGEAAEDSSGWYVSLSSDGKRVAIGAGQNDGNGNDAGHVRIYEENGGVWTQVGSDIDGEAAGDASGSVSISSDGKRVAIGAIANGGNGTTSGHVRIYEENGGVWAQVGSDIDGEMSGDFSGTLSLSSNGKIVAIGALFNDGNGSNSGHVRMFQENGGVWAQISCDIDGEAEGDYSGNAVSLSSDGTTVAIGARLNDGNGNNSGHVRVYENNSIPQAPGCTQLISPSNGATQVGVNATLTWDSIPEADGYLLTIGTSSGGNNILDQLDVGNQASYTPGNLPAFNSTIYVTITPYNSAGNANDCPEESFVTVLCGGTPTANFDTSVNGLEVSFTSTSTTTGPPSGYSWNFGDGNGSNEAAPTHTYSSEGTYSCCLTITDDCGVSGPYCEDITVINSNTLIFEIDSICGNTSDVVSVPVVVQNFENIEGFQMFLHISDPSVAAFVGASNYNLPGMNANTFQVISDDTLSLIWFTSGGVTLADDTPIFSVDISLVGSAGESSNVFMENILVFDSDVNNVPATSNPGSVCISATSEIYGKIYRENLDEVSQVMVELTGGQDATYETTSDGLYEFTSLTSGENYVITPQKDINPVNGVNVGDILKIQKFINQVDGFITTPYQRIAADVSNDGLILVNDILFIQKLINNNISTFPNGTPSWKFVSSDYVFTSNTPESEDFAQVRVYDQISGTFMDQDFIGVKMGDVDNSGNPLNLNDTNNNLQPEASSDFLEILIDSIKVAPNELITIPIKANNLNDLCGMQFSINWDTSILSFVGLDNFNLDNLNESSFSLLNTNKGELPLAWFSDEPHTLANSSILFEIQFKVIGKENSSTEISFSNSPTPISFFDSKVNPISFLTTKGNILNGLSTTTNDLGLGERIRIYPNPVFDEVLNIQLARFQPNKEWNIRVINVHGQVVKSLNNQFNSTLIKIPVDGLSGIYFVEVFSDDLYFIEKVFIK